MSDEKIGFTEEELEYLRECATEPQERWDTVTRLLEFFEKTLKEEPEKVGEALEEILKRNG